MKIHLIANSHLDPVWLWDWREGLNEGFITCRAILDLMDEYPELTYIRGEASIYRHVETHDPATYVRIRKMVKAGRWDVVGGTVCQPDTNLPATETLVRHFARGLDYFSRKLGRRPTVGWAADSFGHSAGWPEIYHSAGIRSFAFSRPFERDLGLPGPVFWWTSPAGARILCWRIPIGWYGSNRGEISRRLDEFVEKGPTLGVENVALTFGLGNHGGGPSRREIEDVLEWRRAHPEIAIEFSTLHQFFDALHGEARKLELPEVRGELNFTLRGCYSSAAKLKFAYRRAENQLLKAERCDVSIAAHLGRKGAILDETWDGLLFNTFHDVLPGTCIESATALQLDWIGSLHHEACRAELGCLNALALQMDTRVPRPADNMPSAVPVIVWNPVPRPVECLVEFEACLDYRPIRVYSGRAEELPVAVRDARGKARPFQLVETENHFGPREPWRRRFVVPMRLPSLGWDFLSVAWDERAPKRPEPTSPVRIRGRTSIENERIRLVARKGGNSVKVKLDGKSLFGRGGIQVGTFHDPHGSWGNHDGEREGDDISVLRELWSIQRIEVLERGPYRAALWVEFGAGSSRLDLELRLSRGVPRVDAHARLTFNERSARVKLVFPGAAQEAVYEVPGGTISRKPCGEVPGGRWVKVSSAGARWVFASDSIYNFDQMGGAFRATIARSTRYAWNSPSSPDDEPWRPHMDLGEHRFRFAVAPAEDDPYLLAEELEMPPVALVTAAHAGEVRRSGSLLEVPEGFRLLALKRSEDGKDIILRAENTNHERSKMTVRWLGRKMALGEVPAGRIASWRLALRAGSWKAAQVDASERPIT